MAKVYESFEQMSQMMQSEMQRQAFWDEYFAMETEVYKMLLKEMAEGSLYTGTEAEMAEHYGMEPMIFANFIDGINTSLEEPIDLETLDDTTPIDWKIIPEKLYFNMRDAKAPWLFNLEEWDAVLPEEERNRITREWRQSKQVHIEKRPGRNDPCPCGSGKKYKKCCMKKDMAEEAG